MGKTAKSSGTRARSTDEPKKLTPRRIKVIEEFLALTRDSPDTLGEFLSVAWKNRLIIFLREPMRCRSTEKDILDWLKNDCFKKLIDEVLSSAAKRAEPRSEAMQQPITAIKSEPMFSGEDVDTQLLPSLDAIKTEKEDIEDQQWYNHEGQMDTGNHQEESLGLLAIKEEPTIATVKEEPYDDFENHQCLDLSFNRSAVAAWDDKWKVEHTDQVMELDEPLGVSSLGYDVTVSSEEIPVLSTCSHFSPEHAPHFEGVSFTTSESTDFVKKTTDRMINMVQDLQWRNDVSKDWNSIYQALTIVKTVLKDVK